jgi:tetratricopeptide (TPR) repeat protein
VAKRRRTPAAPPRPSAPAVPPRREPLGEGRTPRAWSWPVAAVVAALAVAVYANSLGGALMFDDVNAIVRNERVRRGDPVAIFREPSWWTEGFGRGWRPVTSVTFAANHALHGLAPAGYHVANVLLHAAVSVLVLAVLARVTGAPLAAALAALLFAAHPVHTEAVASVVGRAELLAAGGFFLAWLFFLRADDAAGGARRRLLEAAGALAFFAGALAKENALALLPVLVLADVLFPRRGGSAAEAVRRHAPRYALLAGVAVLFMVLRRIVIGADPPGIEVLDNPLVVLPLGVRLLTAVEVAGLYGLRLLFPLWLSADYSHAQIAPVRSPLDSAFLAALVLVLLVVAGLVWAWRRAPVAAFALGFLVLTFAMVSNLVFLIGTIMAERLIYLPSAGFCLLAGALLASLAGAPPGAPVALARLAAARVALPLAVVLALYAARTWTRNQVWRDPLVFFTAMVEDAPRSARSQRELGGALAAAGRIDDARRAFERSLAIMPDDPATLYNLGNALLQAGQLEAAIAAYERALAVKPDFADAMVNFGNVESLRGNEQAALVWMQRALVLAPASPSLHMNVANTLFRLGQHDQARAEYEAALRLAPDAPDILTNYGTFLLSRGEIDAAIAVQQKAAGQGVPMAYVGLAASYRAKGMMAEARRTQARAAELFPENGAVRQMGEVLRRDAAAAP